VRGMVRPETSRLDCEQIKNLIAILPPGPGSFVLANKSHYQWECDQVKPGAGGFLLRCEHGDRRFSIIRG
jgi:hypothetical protein